MIENIREQAYVVEKIAEGDMTVDVRVKSDKDLLGKKLKEMVEINNEVLSNINEVAAQVAAGAKQVSDSSMQLSQGATEQASSIEELTASLNRWRTRHRLVPRMRIRPMNWLKLRRTMRSKETSKWLKCSMPWKKSIILHQTSPKLSK